MSLPAGPHSLPAQRACLIVLDGWGLAEPGPGNAVELASTPVFDELWAAYPHTTLVAWGRAVGLPEGQMGNCEVGHLNLGAGSVVRQDLVRIDDALADGTLAADAVLRESFLGAAPPRVHLIGLVSDGGVHSSIEHLRALIALAARARRPGSRRCTPSPTGATRCRTPGVVYLRATGAPSRGVARRLGGRPLLGDGPRPRWDRVQRAYDLLVLGRARAPRRRAASRPCARPTSAARPTSSSTPTLVGEDGRIRPGDSVLCFNFRPDRMREITRALAEPGFARRRGSARLARARRRPPSAHYTTLTEYEEHQTYPVAFGPSARRRRSAA